MKNFNYAIWNRARDLLAYSAVPQPTAPPRTPDICTHIHTYINIYECINNQLDAQFFFRVCLFQFSTCFGQPCAHPQEN